MNTHSLDKRNVQDIPIKGHNDFFNKIGYVFKQPALLQEALTHRSFGTPNNERLEFLGDSALNCAVSALLFNKFPGLPEGNLSRLRANLVNQYALFELASELGLGDLIRLGEGERKSGGHHRPSILANALEAVIGAIYLEGGFVQVENFVGNLYKPLLQNLDLETLGKDPKTMLQEYLQSRRIALPEYTIITTSGEAHRQKFKVECVIPKFNIRTIGEGTSRRRAEQEAAKQAYELVIQN